MGLCGQSVTLDYLKKFLDHRDKNGHYMLLCMRARKRRRLPASVILGLVPAETLMAYRQNARFV